MKRFREAQAPPSPPNRAYAWDPIGSNSKLEPTKYWKEIFSKVENYYLPPHKISKLYENRVCVDCSVGNRYIVERLSKK